MLTLSLLLIKYKSHLVRKRTSRQEYLHDIFSVSCRHWLHDHGKHSFWYSVKEFANAHRDPMNVMVLTGRESCKHVLKLAFLAPEILYSVFTQQIYTTITYQMCQTNLLRVT